MIRKHGLDMHDPATRQMMDRPYKCHLCIFSSFSSSGTTSLCYASMARAVADIVQCDFEIKEFVVN